LRAVCEAGDQGFDFGSSMATYNSMVAYHAPTGETVRGSVLAEMVSRCVVEALASTLYQVLAVKSHQVVQLTIGCEVARVGVSPPVPRPHTPCIATPMPD
jgi:hypothetical protein